MSTLTVVLSWPEHALNPNARPNWRDAAHAKKVARQEARLLAGSAINESGFKVVIGQLVPVNLLACPPNKRNRDRDNFMASCKAYLDGLADALGCNDSVFVPSMEWGDLDPPRGRVVVTIGETR